MPKCKVGDRAIVLRSIFPANIGRIVQVLKPAREPRAPSCGPEWWVRAEGRPMQALNGDGRRVRRKHGDIPDAWLCPLRDPGLAHEKERGIEAPDRGEGAKETMPKVREVVLQD